jgi:invasion protein IalB
MNDQMRTWLTRGAVLVGVFVLGGIAGWIGHGSSGNQARILFYDDWRLTCPADTEQKGACNMGSEIVDPKSGAHIAQFTLGHEAGKDGDAEVAVVSVPLTVLIPPGVGFQVGSQTMTYPYVTCLPTGCIAKIPVDDKMRALLDGAQTMEILVTAQSGRTFNLPLSVKGYADASKAFRKIEARRHSWWRRLWS